jgi:hypothetical protein
VEVLLRALLPVFSVTLSAQIYIPPIALPPASIDGIVLSDSSGQPLRRAQVLLRSSDSASRAMSQSTGDSGAFSFSSVPPGLYSISVHRDGYLPATSGFLGAYRMPPVFHVEPGATLQGFTVRMKSWGVISGRVRFDDAEPAVNVAIQLYREYFQRGRHGYSVAASSRTDDRGEYRVHGLEPGLYYVAAAYQAPGLPPDAEEQRRAANGVALDRSYALTFYPSVQRLDEAVPVQISEGSEIRAVDISLDQVPTVRITGRVTSASSGRVIPSPGISLRRGDPDNTASVTAPGVLKFDEKNNFEIRGVTPGPYVLIANGSEDGKPLTGRRAVQVSEGGVTNLDIVIGPPLTWKGKVTVEGDDSVQLAKFRIALEPRRETSQPSRAEVSDKGDFSVEFVPREMYDVYLANAPEDAYLKAVRVANSDKLVEGLEAEPGDPASTLEVLVGLKGGKVLGKAQINDMTVASGASVALIPDPPDGRVQGYKTTSADEYGNFLLQGIPPGRYTAVAWYDTPPCDFYNPDALAACRARGASITVDEGSYLTVGLKVN